MCTKIYHRNFLTFKKMHIRISNNFQMITWVISKKKSAFCLSVSPNLQMAWQKLFQRSYLKALHLLWFLYLWAFLRCSSIYILSMSYSGFLWWLPSSKSCWFQLLRSICSTPIQSGLYQKDILESYHIACIPGWWARYCTQRVLFCGPWLFWAIL